MANSSHKGRIWKQNKGQRRPGKDLTKSIVIDEYGNKPELRAIILRSLIRLFPMEPFSYCGDNYSKGWHDRWAKTWVVTEEELQIIKKLQVKQIRMTRKFFCNIPHLKKYKLFNAIIL